MAVQLAGALAEGPSARNHSVMKLFYTSTSPFVRKCLVVAHELGIAERIETEALRPSPTELSPRLSAVNPLNKIPALITEDGTVLYDSPVLCEYLTSLVPLQTLLAAAGPRRWTTLRRQALADGILDSAVLVFYERQQRPAPLRWEAWLVGQTRKACQGLDAFELEAPGFGDTVDVGLIALAVTLGWLEFRNVLDDVRSSRPQLFSWYDVFSQRTSMLATLPRA